MRAIECMDTELTINPLYIPGELWTFFGNYHLELLKAYGVENFKRTVSHNYQNWLISHPSDLQFQKLLDTWVHHRRIEPFINNIERPDHVGIHGNMDFQIADYALADERGREVSTGSLPFRANGGLELHFDQALNERFEQVDMTRDMARILSVNQVGQGSGILGGAMVGRKVIDPTAPSEFDALQACRSQ